MNIQEPWSLTPEVVTMLLELLPDGLPRVSKYNEYLHATGQHDSAQAFLDWSRATMTLMGQYGGEA